jgi:hypothetical protein
VKSKYEFKKKTLDFQKIENHVSTFPYWFWSGNNLLNVYRGSWNMSSFNVRSLPGSS